jgi:hypothetical protein
MELLLHTVSESACADRAQFEAVKEQIMQQTAPKLVILDSK